MNQTITIEVTDLHKSELEVLDFYKSCGRETMLDPTDVIFIARSGNQILGVVRLCLENEVYVLRTMQVLTSLQGNGIGRMILNNFKKFTVERCIRKVYCMPYSHLENFYGLIGFQKIDESSSPSFLQERAKDFHRRNPSKHVILMST